MAGEQMTEREAALTARVKELEDAQAKSQARTAEGGVFDGVWRRIADIIPPWLAATAAAVLIAHYGFDYYLQSQATAAETQLKQAKANLETAKSKAANSPDAQGATLRLATLKAEIDNKRADAAAAKSKATALNAEINGESAALAAAKANLDNLQNQARGIKAKADAEGAKFGLSTLEERAVRAKLKAQQIDVFTARGLAAFNRVFDIRQALSQRPKLALVEAECTENPMAEEIGCPARYIQRKPQQQNGLDAPPAGHPAGWTLNEACTVEWRKFQAIIVPAAFAVSKSGACGWRSSPSEARETIRRTALTVCERARRGGDPCQIIVEK